MKLRPKYKMKVTFILFQILIDRAATKMGGGPSKEELEHREYMERKRLERLKEEDEHKERMKGKYIFCSNR